MHYYQFNIGDYIKNTLHLSVEEDLAYRRLLDFYYDSEQPIPNDIPWVSRRLRMGSDIIQSVLNEFFVLTEKGYSNHRADLEIESYHEYMAKQKANGMKGGRPKKTQTKPTANPSQTQNNPKQEPLTTNQEPRTNIKEGCDAVLFIDSDMRFPHDIISIMLSREVPIVGVNATTRRKPVTPTAKMLRKYMDGETIVHEWSNIDSRGKEGIEEVTAVGFGAVMIRREVFEKTGRPWFDAGWGASGVCGEDVYFCVKAGSEGFQTYVDHELSMHIRHIGTYEYGWKDFEQLEE